jgi:rhodanese-related sulfurtransferase
MILIPSPLRIVCLCAAVWLCCASSADTASVDRSRPAQADRQKLIAPRVIEATSAYCGIYSLVACMNAVGLKPDIGALWQNKYIESKKGSTAAELIQAAQDVGCHTNAFQNLTHRELARATCPMILHVRANSDSSQYDHWVAFLGFEGNRIRIYNPSAILPVSEVETFSPAEVLANWDGLAIGVSDKPIDSAILAVSRIDDLFIVCAVGLAVLISKGLFYQATGAPRWTPRTTKRQLAAQIAGLLIAAFILAELWHFGSEIGFLTNSVAVADVSARYQQVKSREITLEQLKSVVANHSAIIFDARGESSFKQGAISGARSFPVNSTLPERADILRGIKRSEKIIVYCQNARCPFGDRIAAFLKLNGYDNVAIFRGGYREWARLKQKGPESASR